MNTDSDTAGEQHLVQSSWTNAMRRCCGRARVLFDDLKRNVTRICTREDERKTRTLLLLGVLTNLNAIITNSLNLAGLSTLAMIFGVVLGVLTIIAFLIQSGLFDSVAPA